MSMGSLHRVVRSFALDVTSNRANQCVRAVARRLVTVVAAVTLACTFGEGLAEALPMARLKAHFTPTSEHVIVSSGTTLGHYFCSSGHCWNTEVPALAGASDLVEGSDILSTTAGNFSIGPKA
jgi:uncharacterized protein affecting Mg2+/Co2+ transport